MKLSFPNPSRSFDTAKNRVRFWGYDSTMEVAFFVEAGALLKLSPDSGDDEADILKAFDAMQKRIHETADRVHGHAQKGAHSHILAAKDF